MRFQISSLLWLMVCIALAAGWCVDHYRNQMPTYEKRLADHAILAANLADVHRLHSMSDFPEAYSKRMPEMLFSTFIQLFQNKSIFERSYGPIGNAKEIDAKTLRELGGETLKRIPVSTLAEFIKRLDSVGAWKNPKDGLYDDDGAINPALASFVTECLESKRN
jgi:hypothetical protein